MSHDTILGGPPSEADADGDPTTSGDLARALEFPGDTETAFHRGQVYALLALGFDRPGEDFDEAVAAGAYRTHLVESAAVLDDHVADVAPEVGAHVDAAADLHGDWASLFGVEEGLTVSPYELTYLPGPLVTNVRQLADISGFYEAFGLSVADGMNDRRDHVCFELEFMTDLATREARLRVAGEDDGIAVVVDAQRKFLEDHLGRWYWRFAAEVSQLDHGFYAVLADLLAALVEYELDRLDIEPDWVPDDPAVTEWNEGIFGEAGRSCGGCGMNQDGIDTGTDAMKNMDYIEAVNDVDEMMGYGAGTESSDYPPAADNDS